MKPDRLSRLLRRVAAKPGRRIETDQLDFTACLAQLSFRDGLTSQVLTPRLTAAGCAAAGKRLHLTDADFEAFMACGGDVVPLTLLHRAAGIVGRTVRLEIL